MNRFEGRVTQINKEGHLGVIAHTEKPIEKVPEMLLSGGDFGLQVMKRTKQSVDPL